MTHTPSVTLSVTHRHTLPTYTDISHLNTMALSCQAKALIKLTNIEEVFTTFKQLQDDQQRFIIISNGSNIILPPVLDAVVISPALQGQTVLADDKDHILLEVMAGENWHDLVVNTVNQGWYGLENLALIPSWVGGSPVQNIGAYGVQVDELIDSVHAFHIPTLTWHHLSRVDCAFGYRDSMFKHQAGDWLITSVIFRLSKVAHVNTNYGDVLNIAQKLATEDNRSDITPIDTMHAIIHIRKSKLPDPAQLPNCGSFFKNPLIARSQLEPLLQRYPNLVHYPTHASNIDNRLDADDKVKVAAGWLIEQAGLKGKGVAPILTHTKQALVLTNHAPNQANQQDIANAMRYIQRAVFDKFGIHLEPEPVWIEADGSICQTC